MIPSSTEADDASVGHSAEQLVMGGWFIAALGALSAIMPLAIDMYLPAFDSITRDVGAGGHVTLTFTAFQAATAFGPLIYGPLTDRFGRRMPMQAGLVLFIVSSLLCAVATTLPALVLFRFLQGIGGSAGVLALAVVRDVSRGSEAMRMMAMLMLMHSVSPLFAPAIGSGVTAYASWRVIFVLLAAIGVFSMIMSWFALPETLPLERRSRGGFGTMVRTFGEILPLPSFLWPTLVGSAAQSALLVYVAFSSSLFIDHFGLAPLQYSLVFALGGAILIGTAQVAGRLSRRRDVSQLTANGCAILAVAGLLLCATAMFPAPPLALVIAALWIMLSGLGFVLPSAMVLSIDAFDQDTGSAAALGNSVKSALAACTTLAAGLLAEGDFHLILLITGILALLAQVGWTIWRRSDAVVQRI